MNKHLDDYLCKKYPKIFADRNKSPRDSCMHWGFSHGDGWFFLIDALCYAIQSHIDNPPYVYKKTLKVYAARVWNGLVITLHLPFRFQIYGEFMEPGVVPQVVARQVKEKFGGLRFYADGGDAQIRGMVRMAEMMAHRTCEICGITNELVNQNARGWIQTTCPCCARDKENHLENRRTELVELWKQVQTDKQNDRR